MLYFSSSSIHTGNRVFHLISLPIRSKSIGTVSALRFESPDDDDKPKISNNASSICNSSSSLMLINPILIVSLPRKSFSIALGGSTAVVWSESVVVMFAGG